MAKGLSFRIPTRQKPAVAGRRSEFKLPSALVAFFISLIVFCHANATELDPANPILRLSVRQATDNDHPKTVELSLADLKKKLNSKTFEVLAHPEYGNNTMKYRGFLFRDVIQLIAKTFKLRDTSNYIYSAWASDNFSALITPEDMTSGTAVLAWTEIAGENGGGNQIHWTPVAKHGSPGPFYLVWDNPKTTYWKKWPFKIAEVALLDRYVTKKFDLIAPNEDANETKGYRLVVKNCTSCHKIAGVGFSDMGPDLKVLLQVRDLASFTKQIRTPMARMAPFDSKQLSDEDIKSIYAYLGALKVKPAH